MPIMHYRPLLSVSFATTAALVALTGLSGPSPAQTAATAAAPPAKPLPLQLKCDAVPMPDPFKGKLAGRELPSGIIPVGPDDRSKILSLDLPCQDRALPTGPEDVGLDNLQRTFDFYSWRTFIALNSPADGKTTISDSKPDTRTRWEDMDNFKQLLDVMLPARLQPPKWPTDRAGMEAERERLMPEECRALHKQMPDRMVVKMIEESFNEPFKTGPLIDQQGHYAIFDILMNRQMFNYIMANHLNTKAGQAANTTLSVDFPAGQNAKGEFGAFMLKVSWKILSAAEIEAKNFHMIDALVLMPEPSEKGVKPQCLHEQLGLVGFHAVHKTASRPQWIWTSFEHVQNVPARDEVTAHKLNGPYNFFSVTCKGGCTENATPPTPWDPDPALPLQFRKNNSFKSQIVR